MANKKSAAETYSVYIDDVAIPVQVYYERRRNVRVSSGRNAVLLRMPLLTSRKERNAFKEWCTDWVHKQWKKNPGFRSTFTTPDLVRCKSIVTADREFQVERHFTASNAGSVKANESRLHLRIPEALRYDDQKASDMIYRLVHKGLAQAYLPRFIHRIVEMHSGKFSKEVASVKLRNMSSKWGSCSSEGKLSFSTRLIFAPVEVRDYVILHELCHLDELNHSPRYWNLVGSFDPHYEEKEEWLRLHGHQCDIQFNMETEEETPVNRTYGKQGSLFDDLF